MPEPVKLPTNQLYCNIFLRTLSHASSLGADSGECFHALQDAIPLNPTTWMIAWSELASRLNQHAASLLETRPPQRRSAKLAYLRAANYHRTAFFPLFSYPLRKDAVMPSYKTMRANFASAAELFDPPLIPLRIPFNGAKMRGYLANPLDTYRNGRLIVIISGHDAPMEELYFFCTHHALSRGYSIVAFDGPGQGGTLLESGMKLSHDFGEVLASVLDVAAEHGTWRRTVVMGLPLGGPLCLKAVSGSKMAARVHAVVADPAELNLIDTFRARLSFPQNMLERLPNGPAWAIWLLHIILRRMAASQSVAGWALRRGMLVHGCHTPLDYMISLQEFDNQPILGQIKIPVLITRAQKDEMSDQAELVYHKLINCEKKTFMIFRDDDGAYKNCETGARMLFSERVFAWLDETLS
jgi:alpha-beta hydrolase superfamily lysophospholipase